VTLEQQGTAPLSYAQQRLWFLEQLRPDSLEYLVPWAWRLSGPLDTEVLTEALRQVVDRHDVLRTALRAHDGGPVQVIEAGMPVRLPVVDAAGRDADSWASELMARPIRLSEAPLWRALLVRYGPAEHVLILVWHHVVVDAWSAGILLREMSLCYRATLAGRAAELPALDVQYADFARSQRETLTGPVLDEQLTYWREQLAGVPNLDLPADRPRDRVRSTAGATVTFVVPDDVADGLRQLAKTEHVTFFMVLLAAFQALLGRYSGQDDIAVGTPLANRNRADVEPLIGFFLNSMVIRTDLGGDPSFAELLRRVRSITLDAYDNEDLPFERLVEHLRPDRDLSRTPLFQAMFIVNNVQPVDWDLPGIRAEECPLGLGHAKYDLTAAFMAAPEGLTGFLRYSTALFDRGRIERMRGHLLNMLAAVVADPSVALSRLPILTEDEHRQLVGEWHGTAPPLTRPPSVHELVEAQAAERPGAVALIGADGEQLTYRELDNRANRFARHLRELGAGPESVVGVCLRRAPATVVTLLGILKAGAAYLPISPDDPAERVRGMLVDADARLVVATSATVSTLPGDLGDRLVVLDDPPTRAAIDGRRSDCPQVVVHPDNLAYVTYTSGSTGVPKSVLTSHGAVVSHLAFLREEYRLGPADTAITLADLGFDASVREIFGTLASGARLVVPRPSVARDPAEVVRILRTAGVTVVPSVVPTLLYEIAAVPCDAPGKIRLVLCAGERLRSERLAACPWLEGRVINQYGPTEATMTSTRHRVIPAESSWTCPVGRPIAGAQVYVLEPGGTPCPIGVPGEVFIGGTGLARGYGGRPGLTAARFVPDPFGSGGRLYRTGDVGRWSDDGVLEFLGRMDHQVKVRGIRVEPAEIEARLLASPLVAEAVVVARPDAAGDLRLVAYVVAATGAGAPVPELRSWLAAVLPGALIPTAFVVMPSLPLTVNGKVDRAALPAPDTVRPALTPAFVAPRSPVEQLVADVWRDLLGVDRVGVFDDFFDLGGHSLLASRVVTRLGAAGVSVPLRALFEAPSVAGLAGWAAGQGASGVPGLTALNGAGTADTLFCVHDGTGGLAGYFELARVLRFEWSVVGVDFDPALASTSGDMIGALADCYAKRLRDSRRGPFALCGWSFGGILAYETACRLQHAGEVVDLVCLVDSVRPAPDSEAQRDVEGMLADLVVRCETVGDGQWATASGELAARLDSAGISADLIRLGKDGLTEALRRLVSFQLAKHSYQPSRADLPVLVLRAASNTTDRSWFERWHELAPRTEIVDVPGDHVSVMAAPAVHAVVAQLRRRMG
jgi:amino acid adenylation domain-containing protein